MADPIKSVNSLANYLLQWKNYRGKIFFEASILTLIGDKNRFFGKSIGLPIGRQ